MAVQDNINTKMNDQSELPVHDSRELVPDICRETRQLAIDLIRRAGPTTVLGVLIERDPDDPIVLEALAGRLGRSVGAVSWTVDMLVGEKLCGKLEEDGITRVVAVAPYEGHDSE